MEALRCSVRTQSTTKVKPFDLSKPKSSRNKETKQEIQQRQWEAFPI